MILITGATGTVGREVIKRLCAHGAQIRAVTRDPQKGMANRLPNVKFVQGDFEDVDSMRRACSGVDRAFLLTNSTTHGGPTDSLHACGSRERRAAHREAVTVACRPEFGGTVSSLSRGGRSVGPHIHLSAAEPLHARSTFAIKSVITLMAASPSRW